MKKSANNTSPRLSVIILNYNSGKYLSQCLKSILNSSLTDRVEIIVADNQSTDNSFLLAKRIKNTHKLITQIKLIPLGQNRGFAAGNNQAVSFVHSSSDFVLFLNPDTIVNTDTLQKTIGFFDSHHKADAVTCQVVLVKTGRLQPECHRGFPTPWSAFAHFTGLNKLFPRSAIFNNYFLGHLDLSTTHQIDSCVGAFFAIRRPVGDKLGWWNEQYFFYGEDIDFCYRLKQQGYRLYYYPRCSVKHFQGISSGIKKQTRQLSSATRQTKIKIAKASTQAMRIFYQQHLFPHYHPIIRHLVLFGITLLEQARCFKAKYL